MAADRAERGGGNRGHDANADDDNGDDADGEGGDNEKDGDSKRPSPFKNPWVWIGIVVFLYFPCRWFARLKSERRTWWLSYL